MTGLRDRQRPCSYLRLGFFIASDERAFNKSAIIREKAMGTPTWTWNRIHVKESQHFVGAPVPTERLVLFQLLMLVALLCSGGAR
jgi:hypothetical protein